LGESQVVTLVDIHGSHNGQTLDVVGVCVNQIGTVKSNHLSVTNGMSGGGNM
jgi:hypothetical protein